jgi:hypothetical protein
MKLVKNDLSNNLIYNNINFRNYNSRMRQPNNTFSRIEVNIYQTLRRIDFTLDRKYRVE